VQSAARLAVRANLEGASASLRDAFDRPLGQVESEWRAHLARVAAERGREVTGAVR
jgi:hypothetical protein